MVTMSIRVFSMSSFFASGLTSAASTVVRKSDTKFDPYSVANFALMVPEFEVESNQFLTPPTLLL